MRIAIYSLLLCFPILAQDLKLSEAVESLPAILYPPLARVAGIQGYAQIIVTLKNGQVLDLREESDGHSPFKQAPGLVSASKSLLGKFKFKDSASGYIHVHFFYYLNLPLPVGSTQSEELNIDWQRNIVKVSSERIKLDVQPLHGAKS